MPSSRPATKLRAALFYMLLYAIPLGEIGMFYASGAAEGHTIGVFAKPVSTMSLDLPAEASLAQLSLIDTPFAARLP